ncbi:hypothetical protein [Burkholderia cenocepacia]|uniref:hypothetical protein n=1 Tax=Burkholderia cenocepacia TaxID=95486 RepID=UPI002AB6CF75|nr:hypothetical protein [Burkholderia cenocepacia]
MNQPRTVSASGEQSDAAVSDRELLQRLHERAADCRQKSMTARLAAVLGLVEEILQRGYDRSQVREILTEAEWRFTPDSFDSALSRLRKRRSNRVTEQGAADESNLCAATDSSAASDREPSPMADSFLARTGPSMGRRWK